MPTLTDEQYAALMEAKSVADFVSPIWNDPKTKGKAQALVKEFYPHLEIPGYDSQKYVDEKFAERDQRAAEAAQRAREADEERTWRQQREETIKEFGLTDEGITEVEDFMRRRNVGDYKVAAAHLHPKQPKASTPTHSDRFWNHKEQPGFADIAKDPEKWGFNELVSAIERDEQRAQAW